MKNGHSFNVILSLEQYQRLEALAKQLEIPKGQVIRSAFLRLYNHVILNQPTCANGQRCYVPQMHPPAPLPVHAQQLPLPGAPPPQAPPLAPAGAPGTPLPPPPIPQA